MSETRWTPGPWKVKREPEGVVTSGFAEQMKKAGVPHRMVVSFGTPFALGVDVAAVPTFGGLVGSPEAVADLIAAAPALYEALVLAYEAMNYMGDVLNDMDAVEPEDEEKTTPAFEAVRAALALARGEQP